MRKVILLILISTFVVYGVSLRVIFAKNTTEPEPSPTGFKPLQSNVLNAPMTCKPGHFYDASFSKRCRKVSGWLSSKDLN